MKSSAVREALAIATIFLLAFAFFLICNVNMK